MTPEKKFKLHKVNCSIVVDFNGSTIFQMGISLKVLSQFLQHLEVSHQKQKDERNLQLKEKNISLKTVIGKELVCVLKEYPALTSNCTILPDIMWFPSCLPTDTESKVTETCDSVANPEMPPLFQSPLSSTQRLLHIGSIRKLLGGHSYQQVIWIDL